MLAGVPWDRAKDAAPAFHAKLVTCDATPSSQGGCASNPTRNTAILSLPGAVLFDAKMGIDADGSALSKAHSWPNQPETSLRYPDAAHTSLDAEHVPYIVLPGGGFGTALGIRVGDIAAVVWKGKVAFAVVGDVGPAGKLGEGSMALHDLLGHPSCKTHDPAGVCTRTTESSIAAGVVFIVFPNSKKLIAAGLSPANITERLNQQGQMLFNQLTGKH